MRRLGVEELRLVSRLAGGMRRGARECGLGVYLMLAEVAVRGEMSSSALDRVMRAAGYRNPRQYRHEAQGAVPRLIRCREDGEGKWWSLTPAGLDVLVRLVDKLEGGDD